MIDLHAGMKGIAVGLGKSGLAAVRYLHSQGLRTAASEQRRQLSACEEAVLDQCGAEVETGGHTAAFFADADLLVVSPGVPLDIPALQAARNQGVQVVSELALAAGRIPVPVIAVTGSNGKTTVTSLIGHLLRCSDKQVFVGGNIGTPVLDWLRHPDEAEAVVLELSSFQLEAAGDFRPDIGLLLNLSPDHLDRHGSFARYMQAKLRLFAWQRPDDKAIVCADDPELAKHHVLPGAAQLIRFGTGSACRVRVEKEQVRVEPGFAPDRAAERYDLAGTQLRSPSNVSNAAAAISAARALGCSVKEIQAGLADFQPLLHRMTPVQTINSVCFVNDSKATNIGALQAALSGFAQDVILIAGGRNKGGDFSELIPALQRHVRQAVLLGEARAELAAAAAAAGIKHHFAADMRQAVAAAFAAAQPGNTVLLAPACSSFDMFDSYEHRGREFMRCVAELAKRRE
jgi:UDP-N-acetylmuramoylalanine--D-glutamate ligase